MERLTSAIWFLNHFERWSLVAFVLLIAGSVAALVVGYTGRPSGQNNVGQVTGEPPSAKPKRLRLQAGSQCASRPQPENSLGGSPRLLF